MAAADASTSSPSLNPEPRRNLAAPKDNGHVAACQGVHRHQIPASSLPLNGRRSDRPAALLRRAPRKPVGRAGRRRASCGDRQCVVRLVSSASKPVAVRFRPPRQHRRSWRRPDCRIGWSADDRAAEASASFSERSRSTRRDRPSPGPGRQSRRSPRRRVSNRVARPCQVMVRRLASRCERM